MNTTAYICNTFANVSIQIVISKFYKLIQTFLVKCSSTVFSYI